MAIVNIPTSPDPFYSQITDLEGTNYLLSFFWNQRESVWYLSIATEEGEDIITGIKILIGAEFLYRCADERRPPGHMFAWANSPDDSPPGLDELGIGKRVELVYVSSDDATELA